MELPMDAGRIRAGVSNLSMTGEVDLCVTFMYAARCSG